MGINTAPREPVEILSDGTRTLFRTDRVTEYEHNVTLALINDATRLSEGKVEIYGPATCGTEHRSAKVNWSAMGDVDPEAAKLYATMISLAAQIADTLKVVQA